MSILKLIKQRTAIRKYKNKAISAKRIAKIIEAGIWGPSIHGIQSWKFVIVHNKNIINKISNITAKKSKKINIPTFISIPTIKALASTEILICIYNTRKFSLFASRLNKLYKKNAEVAELSAISAAIQNMILAAEDLKIGSCWLDMPLFCKEDISHIIKEPTGELVALLTLGYAVDTRKYRTPRKITKETVRYLK